MSEILVSGNHAPEIANAVRAPVETPTNVDDALARAQHETDKRRRLVEKMFQRELATEQETLVETSAKTPERTPPPVVPVPTIAPPPTLASQLAELQRQQAESGRTEAREEYRRIVSLSVDGPLTPEDLAKLAALIGTLAIAPDQVDKDRGLLSQLAKREAAVRDTLVVAAEGEKTLPELKKAEAKLFDELRPIQAQIAKADEAQRANKKAKDSLVAVKSEIARTGRL